MLLYLNLVVMIKNYQAVHKQHLVRYGVEHRVSVQWVCKCPHCFYVLSNSLFSVPIHVWCGSIRRAQLRRRFSSEILGKSYKAFCGQQEKQCC